MAIFSCLNQIMKLIDIIYLILRVNKIGIFCHKWTNLFDDFTKLIVETERINFGIFLFLFQKRGYRVARVAVEKTMLKILGLLEALILWSGIDHLAQDAANTPHINFGIISIIC